MSYSSYQSEWMANKRKERKASGLCIECGAEPTTGPRGGRSYCDRCRTIVSARKKRNNGPHIEAINRKRDDRLANGLCVYCGTPTKTTGQKSSRWCDSCRERAKNTRNYSKEKFYRMMLKADAIRVYGGCCEQCGHSNPAVLMFHHVNGDGKDDRANGRGKDALIRHIATNGRQDDIQLLCANCHYAIHWGNPDWEFHLP